LSDNPNGIDSRRIAMLIDGDNAQPSLIGEMLAEAGKYGLGHDSPHLWRLDDG